MEILPFAAAVSIWQLDGDTLIPYVIYYGILPSLPLYPLINVYGPLSIILKAQPYRQLLYKAQLRLKAYKIINLGG